MRKELLTLFQAEMKDAPRHRETAAQQHMFNARKPAKQATPCSLQKLNTPHRFLSSKPVGEGEVVWRIVEGE